MQRGPRFFLFTSRFPWRFPWWGWIFLLPLAVLGVFLGALFLLVFLAASAIGAVILWIRLRWLVRGTSVGVGPIKVSRECRMVRDYDYELKKGDDFEHDQRQR